MHPLDSHTKQQLAMQSIQMNAKVFTPLTSHANQKRRHEGTSDQCNSRATTLKVNLTDHEADQHANLAGALHSSVSQTVFLNQINSDSSGRDPSRSAFQPEPPVTRPSKSKKFLRDGPVVIEMFAGSGRFAAALKSCGVHSAFGVDHKKLSSIAPIMIADLTTRAGQSLNMTWMDTPNLAGIFAAPPCGTCSLARNIKIRGPNGKIISGPVPLRSPVFPEGFPNFSNTNLKRFLAANNCTISFRKLWRKLISAI